MLKINSATAFMVVCLLAHPPVLNAQSMDVPETLRQLSDLVEKQQAELEAQRKELAAQRELIRQLQAAQGIAPGMPVEDGASLAGDEGQTAPEQAKEALARQEAEAPKSAKEEIAELQVAIDDPSNTHYDKDFPGSLYLPGTTAAIKLGGYVNLALVDSFDPMEIQDSFIVGSIPPGGEQVPGAEKGVTVTANQTRLNLEYRDQTNLGEVRAFVEGDFRGNSETFRLRHAFGQFRSVLAGKTWSTFVNIDSGPEEVDVEGMNARVLLRHSQIRWTPEFGGKYQLKLALEDPQTDVLNGTSEKARFDIVGSLGHMPLGPFGRWNYRVGLILRELKATGDTDDTNIDALAPTDSTTGWGITTSGKQPLKNWADGEDFIVWQLTYGKGIGHYINDLQTIGGGDAVFDPAGELRALPVFAGYLSYQHVWPKRLKFVKRWPGLLRSNFNLGVVKVDNYEFQDGSDYKRTVRASANIIYTPTAHVHLGVELLWGERKNKDGSKGRATQLQVAARYTF